MRDGEKLGKRVRESESERNLTLCSEDLLARVYDVHFLKTVIFNRLNRNRFPVGMVRGEEIYLMLCTCGAYEFIGKVLR